MKIYTTYFAKLKKLPQDIVVIPISNSIPGSTREGTSYSAMAGMKYKKLVPPWYVVKDYQEAKDEAKYTERYNELVLRQLDPHQVVDNLRRYSSGYDVALVCYERSGDFCHRNLVAEWLRNAGYEVEEWKDGAT